MWGWSARSTAAGALPCRGRTTLASARVLGVLPNQLRTLPSPQDVHSAGATVREALVFSARLRLTEDISSEQVGGGGQLACACLSRLCSVGPGTHASTVASRLAWQHAWQPAV